MPHTFREYLYAMLMLGTAALLVVGVVVFCAAISLQAYLAAFLILAVATLSYAGARKLKPKKAQGDIQALADYLGRKKVDGKGPTVGN